MLPVFSRKTAEAAAASGEPLRVAPETPIRNVSVRTVLVDDHAPMRDLLRYQLSRSEPERYEIIGDCGTGHEAIEFCLKISPDLLLLDLMLPCINGLEVCKRLRSSLPDMRVLFFSAAKGSTLINEALKLGANGCVGKPCSWKTALEAINTVAAGGNYHDPAPAFFPGSALGHTGRRDLTLREQEVARLIAEGLSTKEIATRLDRSMKTIENHRSEMMEKLNLHDTVGVTRYAITAGLIRPNQSDAKPRPGRRW